MTTKKTTANLNSLVSDQDLSQDHPGVGEGNSGENPTGPQAEKKPRKDFTSLKAWQRGHELNLELHQFLLEYQSELEARPWCAQAQESLQESCVQLMEAFRKYHSWEKVRRYESALYYINKTYYTLFLAQELGIWPATEIIARVQDYYRLAWATKVRFVESSEKNEKNDKKSQSEVDKTAQTE